MTKPGASAPVSVRGLRVETDAGTPIVIDVDLDVAAGEFLGIVGESGSGKTTTLLALLGHVPRGTRFAGGSVEVESSSLFGMSDKELRRFRGSSIAYVAQNAGRALNPALRLGTSFADLRGGDGSSADQRTRDALAAVDLPATQEFIRRLPHQLSGGQQQRVLIAMALSGHPTVVAMDEPTTGLDVVTQAAVIEEIRRLREHRSVAVIYVSHDLAVVSQLADRIAVMYAGRIVEEGPVDDVLRRPRHPYTRGLVQSTPDLAEPRRLEPMPGTVISLDARPAGCAFAARCPQRTDRCEAEVPALTETDPGRKAACFHTAHTPVPTFTPPQLRTGTRGEDPVLQVNELSIVHRGSREVVVAADGIDFDLFPGECLALVGESGSGKTSISRSVIGLKVPESGSIRFENGELPRRARDRSLEQRRGIQYVFQDPFDSLNPRRRVGDELIRSIRVLGGSSRSDARDEARSLLDKVRLPGSVERRFPHQLSGGERQRVALARALAPRPRVLLCDEITSALDVSVQAAILELLVELRDELGLSILFITHDLGVVSAAADRILVLRQGRICEEGEVRQVLTEPQHEYTRQLIAAAPSLSRSTAGQAGTPGIPERSTVA